MGEALLTLGVNHGRVALDVLSRWAHVGTAIVLVGGTIFMRFVLLPATSAISEEAHDALRSAIMQRWKRFVHGGIALLFLSGLYNLIVVAIPKHRGDGLYHALFGIKFLLAMAIFFIASVLVGRSPRFEGMRQQRAKWLGILVVLAVLVVAISGFLKISPSSGA